MKKQSPIKEEYSKTFDLKLFPGLDTLDVNQEYILDITPVVGLYDSVAVFNIKLKIEGTKAWLTTPKYNTIGMLKFFNKDDKGVYKLFYVRNITIAGRQKYTYMREVKLPAK